MNNNQATRGVVESTRFNAITIDDNLESLDDLKRYVQMTQLDGKSPPEYWLKQVSQVQRLIFQSFREKKCFDDAIKKDAALFYRMYTNNVLLYATYEMYPGKSALITDIFGGLEEPLATFVAIQDYRNKKQNLSPTGEQIWKFWEGLQHSFQEEPLRDRLQHMQLEYPAFIHHMFHELSLFNEQAIFDNKAIQLDTEIALYLEHAENSLRA